MFWVEVGVVDRRWLNKKGTEIKKNKKIRKKRDR